MPFYRIENDGVTSATNLDGQGYSLSEAGKDEYTYPVDGWYWFSDLTAAMTGLSSPPGATVVSPRQLRRALIQVGLMDAVDAFMAQAPIEIKTDWEYSTEIRRDYPGWDQFAAAVGKTPADVDAVFALAATIV